MTLLTHYRNRCKAQFYFGDIVVVEAGLIGCILKTWEEGSTFNYDVYVRSFNCIKNYEEQKVQRFILSKELSKEEKEWSRRLLS